jgi:integrase
VPLSDRAEVSRRLGHRSITTTVDLYGHLVPKRPAAAPDALDNACKAALDLP